MKQDRKRHTGSNVQLRAAIEETKLAFLKATLEKTGEKTLCRVDGITRLVNLVTAAEVEVGTAGVTGLADGNITRNGRDATGSGWGTTTKLGSTHDAEGEGKSGNDGELHVD